MVVGAGSVFQMAVGEHLQSEIRGFQELKLGFEENQLPLSCSRICNELQHINGRLAVRSN